MTRISVSEAKGQLTDLVRRAEAGEEIILTRHDAPVVALTPVQKRPSREQRRSIIEKVQREAAAHLKPGPDAARSQDHLYDDKGLPR